jgi:phage replication O-like protein O
MANPQSENGHIDIANEVAEALARYRLSGAEWQVLWVIIRFTWGWHKKDEYISYGVIAEKTGLKRPNVIRAVQSMANKKILVKNGQRTINNLKFNKDYEQWSAGIKNDTTAGIKNDTTTGIKNDTTAGIKNDISPINVLKKHKETIQIRKESTKEKKTRFMKFVFLTEDEHKKLLEKLGEAKTAAMIESLNYYIGSKGDKYKSHYYTILQWLSKDEQKAVGKQGGNDGNRFKDIKKLRAADLV